MVELGWAVNFLTAVRKNRKMPQHLSVRKRIRRKRKLERRFDRETKGVDEMLQLEVFSCGHISLDEG
jgi:hypothetical protein